MTAVVDGRCVGEPMLHQSVDAENRKVSTLGLDVRFRRSGPPARAARTEE
jgi:hypothetical protein